MYGNSFKHKQISNERAKTVYRYLVDNGLSKKQILEYKGKGTYRYCDEKDLEKCPDGIHSRHRKAKIRVFKVQ